MTSVFTFLTWSWSFFILFVIRLNHFVPSFSYFFKYVGGMTPRKPDESTYVIFDGATDKSVSSDPYINDIWTAYLTALKEYLEPSIGTRIFEKTLFTIRKFPIKFKLFWLNSTERK
jgi:hypothetical protein